MKLTRRSTLGLLSSFGAVSLAGCSQSRQDRDTSHEVLVANLSKSSYSIRITIFDVRDNQLFTTDYSLESERVDSTESFSGTPDRIVVEWGENKEVINYEPDIPCSGNRRNVNLVN